MTEPEREPPQQLKQFDTVYWIYATWKIATAIVVVVGGSLPTVVLGWETMIPSGKIVAVGGLIVSAWKAVDLFFDQTISRIASGKTPVPIPGQNGGHTQHIQKDKTG